ncbi:MAG: hypothetical protein JNJ75_08690 [Cyclobacteriaceae bacterium]|nr:hypothetical protein [Cyclobacteriaceae bacterium]
MKDVLDSREIPSKHQYLKKSGGILILYGALVVGFLSFALLSMVVEESHWRLRIYFIIDVLVFVPLIAIPFGLVFIVKSTKRKEGSSITRLIHLVIHLIFAILAIMFLGIFVMDVLHLGL